MGAGPALLKTPQGEPPATGLRSRLRGPASRALGLIGLRARGAEPRTLQLPRAPDTAQSEADRCEVRKAETNQQRLRPIGAGLGQ